MLLTAIAVDSTGKIGELYHISTFTHLSSLDIQNCTRVNQRLHELAKVIFKWDSIFFEFV